MRSRWLGSKWIRNEGAEPDLRRPGSQAVTWSQVTGPEFRGACADLGLEPRTHRKRWELAYIWRVLESAGCLVPGTAGLGFGVGREPLVAALAGRGCRVTATDLPPGSPDSEPWRRSGEYGGGLEALRYPDLCGAHDFDRRVEFRAVDMRRISALEGGYDFLWSSCALEHLGSPAAGLEFVEDSLRLLAPGGLAVHTTELQASRRGPRVDRGPVVFYTRGELEALGRRLRGAGHGCDPGFHLGSSPADRWIDRPPYGEDRHLRVLHGGQVTTSYGLRILRGGAEGPPRR